ncbi:peptide chain release factor N(5)-glutamine methyltransferase [Mycoplasmopsis alligatoris]|uniref:peptide chain release factor N(5)-glutamine methyltransferase n=1 Tax=Mycoplasmopsis alligatoris A21JP2 TaxID=747682 RepID=D4XVT8_9BACT|nr:peptide chain release factor N(5)-glutamine methyltransferase [Mycoplasmopsis alligatoris]EFF41537.1 protein-(glutamine-N5) methyltransferase, release factor-specific [Mycoplasmopsis alligatoris A21JP2]
MSSISQLIKEKRRYGLKQTVSFFEIKQIAKRVPIQKIIGYVEYANVKINLNHKVLIPRYETEELVYLILSRHKENIDILDLCSGSGFIGIALKKNQKCFNITLADIDNEAILQSQENSILNDAKVEIIQSDLFKNINKRFDIIVSNPPYLMKNEEISKSVLDYEPHHALYASDQGLYFYKKIINSAKDYLNKNGKIYFEINPLHILYWEKLSLQINLEIINDINGLARFVVIHY